MEKDICGNTLMPTAVCKCLLNWLGMFGIWSTTNPRLGWWNVGPTTTTTTVEKLYDQLYSLGTQQKPEIRLLPLDLGCWLTKVPGK
jgi:hypothetical protein